MDAKSLGVEPEVIEEYILWRQAKKRLADMPPSLQECHTKLQSIPRRVARREWQAERKARRSGI